MVDLLSKISKIEEFKKLFSTISPLTTLQEAKAWEKFSLEWNYNSNHIEGNTISYLEA